MIDDYTTVVRLIISFALGGIIGFERQQRGKTAGLRTHILVSLGSCLVAILSVNLYTSVQGLTNADPARLAAQVVSGIGFLGAGAIMKEGPTVKGLTTAASLWVVASVGLAVGLGALVGAAATELLAIGNDLKPARRTILMLGDLFHIDNPNAVSSCGCGSSFRTAQSLTGEEMPKSCGH